MEARIVVLHCGRVDITPDIETLTGFLRAGTLATDKGQAFLSDQIQMRERAKPPPLRRPSASAWDRLLADAERKRCDPGPGKTGSISTNCPVQRIFSDFSIFLAAPH